MKATLVRAVAVLCLGVAAAFLGQTGVLLLLSSTLAYLLAVLVQRTAWRGTVLKFDGAGLAGRGKAGPAADAVADPARDLQRRRPLHHRQSDRHRRRRHNMSPDSIWSGRPLMMPAISAAAAFFPLAIRIHASQGDAAVRSHLGECVELLLSVTLPACLGFAVISAHVANVVLGADFRAIAAETMPIVAVAVMFQILTQQYLHASFLLSGRSSFYLINTASIIVVNVVLSYVLISDYGTVGAAWARLGADLFGFVCALILSRRAFPIPLPLGRLAPIMIAALVMALVVAAVDRSLHVSDLAACVVLAGVGVVSYAALCWLFDISRVRGRLKTGVRDVPNQIRKHSNRIRTNDQVTFTIDLDHTALRRRRCAPAGASAHPQSLLELPPGEARESLLDRSQHSRSDNCPRPTSRSTRPAAARPASCRSTCCVAPTSPWSTSTRTRSATTTTRRRPSSATSRPIASRPAASIS